MEYSGKKTERFWMPKQIGVHSEMAHEIRATAAADRRGVREQLGFLIELGLEHRRELLGKAHLSESLHTSAQVGIPKKPPHSVTHSPALVGTEPHETAPPTKRRTA